MNLGIKKIIDQGNGDAIIYTALGAAILANCIPTIADGFYFYKQQQWNSLVQKGEITPEQYWTRDVIGYYTITAGYYAIVLVTIVSLKQKSFSTKSKILLGLVGGGAVISVVLKNIQKDKKINNFEKTNKHEQSSSIRSSSRLGWIGSLPIVKSW